MEKQQNEWQNHFLLLSKNTKIGKGITEWPDGKKYEGEYLDDKKHGFGIFCWENGKKYEGNWFNGKQHGKGKITLSNGEVKVGVWEHGKRVEWFNEE